MAQKKSKKEISSSQKAGIGFGLTAAAITAAGAYFLYGSKSATKNRKAVKGWMLKAKGEVLETLERAEEITEKEYKTLVETACGAYATVKNASVGELKDFKIEMLEHWETLQKSKALKAITGTATDAKKKVIKAVKKKVTSKKVTKKAVAKKVAKKAPAKKATKKVAKKVAKKTGGK